MKTARMGICVILVLLTITARVQSGGESSPSGSCDLSDLYGMAAICETDFICQSQQYDCSSRYETLLFCVTGIVWNCYRGMMTDEELVVKAATVQMMFKTSRSQDFYCSGRMWTHLDVGRYLADNDGACTPAFYDEKDECFSSVSPTLNRGQFLDPNLCSNYDVALQCTREAMKKNCRFSGETRNVSVGHNPFCDCHGAPSTAVPNRQDILPTDSSTIFTTNTLDTKTLIMQTYEPPIEDPNQRVENEDIDLVSNARQNVIALSVVCVAVVISVTMLLIHFFN
ncbi:Hypp5523 [Branchiostoma lanceolatum]|uniref:Hypp5523 protein n=1 Tax=Branchiostoma lanceolatum TaxID=7740 RepID=A0A8J9YS04_BRALA|nr:Hypp5523 [Branchiostoma lanceolatum]